MRSLCVAVALAVLAAAPAGARQRVLHLKVGPFRIEAERDREVCTAVRVPNVPGMEVLGYETRSRTDRHETIGTHHFVAYGYSGASASAFPGGLVDDPGCNGFGPADFYNHRVTLAGSGGEYKKGNWLITRAGEPSGLSQPLPNPADAPRDALIVLNSHYFNLGPRAARGFVKLRLVLGPRDPSKRPLRELIAVDASRTIDVAPGATGAETGTWQADGARNDSTEGGYNPAADVCVLYLTGHMHKRGARFSIAYEEDGKSPQPLLSFTDYVHPGLVYYGRGFLLRAYTAENGHPRFRYTCEHANGTEGKPLKMGCEQTPGVTPGVPWYEAEQRGLSVLQSHAQPCGENAVNCKEGTTGRCVAANLVFGPLSDDDMCILPGALFDPLPGVAPEHACDPFYKR